MPGENPSQPASAAPAQPATPSAPAAAPVAAAPASAPAPILGGDSPANPAQPASAAPAEIKYELKAPEGKTLDQAQLDAYTPVFQKHRISTEAAQDLVNTSFTLAEKQFEAAEKQLGDQVAQETADWAKASREDKEYGGTNFEANAKIANRGLAAFGTPELKSYLVESGMANHPEMVRLFWKIGQKLTESAPPRAGAPGNASKPNPERVLYPSMNS